MGRSFVGGALVSAGALLLFSVGFTLRRRSRRRHRPGASSLFAGPPVARVPWPAGGAWTRGSPVQHLPVVIAGVPLGRSVQRWGLDYLEEAIGDLKVSAHVSSDASLNFASKNFAYEVMPIRDFLRRARNDTGDGKYYYYRSTHTQNRKKASTLEVLGPLASDFEIPAALQADFLTHSSVLRIASSGLRMWLHYDVCDNFLCCIRGRKRVLLFCPTAVGQLYVTGSSSLLGSRLLDLSDFNESSPAAESLWREFPLAREAMAECQEVVLEQGDVLFIPALWLHCTEALGASCLADGGGGLCTTVNVFLLRKELAHLHDPKDVWANRELLPAQDAFKAFDDRLLPALRQVPPVHRAFYCRKAAATLLSEAALAESEPASASCGEDHVGA